MARVPIVDNDAATTLLVSLMLEFDGHTIRVAHSAEEALALLTAKPADLVLTD